MVQALTSHIMGTSSRSVKILNTLYILWIKENKTISYCYGRLLEHNDVPWAWASCI